MAESEPMSISDLERTINARQPYHEKIYFTPFFWNACCMGGVCVCAENKGVENRETTFEYENLKKNRSKTENSENGKNKWGATVKNECTQRKGNNCCVCVWHICIYIILFLFFTHIHTYTNLFSHVFFRRATAVSFRRQATGMPKALSDG